MNFEFSFKFKMENERRSSLTTLKTPSEDPIYQRKYSTGQIADEITKELETYQQKQSSENFFESFYNKLNFSSGSSTANSTPKIVTPRFSFRPSDSSSKSGSGRNSLKPILTTELTLTDELVNNVDENQWVFYSEVNENVVNSTKLPESRRVSLDSRVSTRLQKPENIIRRSKSQDERNNNDDTNGSLCSSKHLTKTVKTSKWMKLQRIKSISDQKISSQDKTFSRDSRNLLIDKNKF